MCNEVGDLAKDVKRNACVIKVVDGWARGSGVRGRGVSPVGDIGARDDPIMATVLEDIDKRHSCERKLVDEEGLVFALEEMEKHHCEGQLLGYREGRHLAAVDVGSKRVDGEMDEDRAQVLDDKNSSPGKLRA